MLLLFQSSVLCVQSPSIVPADKAAYNVVVVWRLYYINILGQVGYLIVSIPDLCTLTYFDYQSCFVCAAWRPLKVSPYFHLMLLLFQSSGLCVQSPSIVPADKAANNVVVVWRLYYIYILGQVVYVSLVH